MGDVETSVNIMIDILEDKLRVLTQVLNITENQENLLLSDEANEALMDFFNEMCKEKQILIDRAVQADAMFQHTFDSISNDFEQYAEENGQHVLDLQNRVKQVMDLDINIRVLERRNKELAMKRKKGKKIELPKASRSYVMELYKKYGRQEN